MTSHNHITVTWTPDGHGDQDVTVTGTATPEQTWEAVIGILVAHVRGGTGMSEDATLRAVIPAVKQAQRYLVSTIGGY